MFNNKLELSFSIPTILFIVDAERGIERKITRPAWAGFKTAEEGRAKICKFLWQKLKNKSNIEKNIMNNLRTLLEQFYNSFRTILELF